MGVDLTSIRSPDFSTNQVTTARCLLATGGPSGVLLRGIVKARPLAATKTTARIQVRRGSRTAAMEAVATEGPGWLVFWKLLGRLQLLSHQDVKENMMQHFLFCVLVCTCAICQLVTYYGCIYLSFRSNFPTLHQLHQEILACRRQRLLQCSHAEVAEELVYL